MTPLLEVRGLVKTFPAPGARRRRLVAVDGVDLVVEAGGAVALVGESGSGKTTLARAMLRLVEPDAGVVRFAGEDLLALPERVLRRRRGAFQMVFQDPATALDPRWRVGDQVAEPLRVHRLATRRAAPARVAELLATVGLAAELAARFPHQLSGGQRQRVAIARALASEPRLLVLDEPVTALDATVRARVLALLAELRRRLGLTLVVVAHDLAMVERVADRVVVLRGGRVVEEGPREALFAAPREPYTAALLAATPRLGAGRRRRPSPSADDVTFARPRP